jgi:ADP-ribosyl-[dinitrogen reductase] hydrolase
MAVVTHETSPPVIHAMEVPGSRALIGLAPCPGTGVFADAGVWARGLDGDLDAIAAWGAAAVVTLIEDREARRPTLAELRAATEGRGMAWFHLPIPDRSAPDTAFEAAWTTAGARLRMLLRDGRRLLLHCMGGRGRSGTIAARLLVELGEPPDAAIARVRRARPGAIETGDQERHVRTCAAPGRSPA